MSEKAANVRGPDSSLGYPEDDMSNLPVDQILELAKKFGVTNVRVFGSRARGDATSDSDLDLLVEYADGTKLAGCDRL